MVLLEEFEALTGFYPSSDLYAEIEKQYSNFDGDKQAFCRAFKKNKNFMASAAQTAANRRKWELTSELEGERLKHHSDNELLEMEIKRLKDKIALRDRQIESRDRQIEHLDGVIQQKSAELEKIKTALNTLKTLFGGE